MDKIAIEISNLSKAYDKVLAVNDLSISVRTGEVFGFLGPNGAGKTTTIKLLAGIIKHDHGSIRLNGIDLDQEPVKYKKNIGYIPDNPFFYPKLTTKEYLNLIMNIYETEPSAFIKEAEHLMNYFNLDSVKNDLIESYSRGMIQKLAIISVFARRPEIILIDEPIVGLDPESVKKFKLLIKNYSSEGKTVFLSTHILEIAEKTCDRVGIIHLGKLRFIGSGNDLKDKYNDQNFEDVFLKLISEQNEI